MSLLSLQIVAADEKNLNGGWGLVVILLLAIGLYFLFRSMAHHLRKARDMRISDAEGDRPKNQS